MLFSEYLLLFTPDWGDSWIVCQEEGGGLEGGGGDEEDEAGSASGPGARVSYLEKGAYNGVIPG